MDEGVLAGTFVVIILKPSETSDIDHPLDISAVVMTSFGVPAANYSRIYEMSCGVIMGTYPYYSLETENLTKFI